MKKFFIFLVCCCLCFMIIPFASSIGIQTDTVQTQQQTE